MDSPIAPHACSAHCPPPFTAFPPYLSPNSPLPCLHSPTGEVPPAQKLTSTCTASPLISLLRPVPSLPSPLPPKRLLNASPHVYTAHSLVGRGYIYIGAHAEAGSLGKSSQGGFNCRYLSPLESPHERLPHVHCPFLVYLSFVSSSRLLSKKAALEVNIRSKRSERQRTSQQLQTLSEEGCKAVIT